MPRRARPGWNSGSVDHLSRDEKGQRAQDVARWMENAIADEVFDLLRRKLYFALQNAETRAEQRQIVDLIRAEGLLKKTINSVYTSDGVYSVREAIQEGLDVEQVGDFARDEVL